ncbi:MAG: carbohydrate-binding protein, partial [Bdellovibrionia bacterium]
TFDGKVPTLQEPSRDEGSSTGNPDTSELAFGAGYWNSGIEVKLCVELLRLQSTAGVFESAALPSNAQEVTLEGTGVSFGPAAVPSGVYVGVSMHLTNRCASGKSIQVKNSRGTFGTNSPSVTLEFKGMATVRGDEIVRFESQGLIENLSTVTRDADVATAAQSEVYSFDSVGYPYSGTRHPLPGIIQAEDFDLGGDSIAYSDGTAGNAGGVYRTGESVDIESCLEGGRNVSSFEVINSTNEYMTYSIDAVSGSYIFHARVANSLGPATFHIELDGVDVSGPISVPNTGGPQVWINVSVPGVILLDGRRTLRLVVDSGSFSINHFQFN